ncbi:MAG: PIG-L family deacetylase [Propionicimonas sp.]
MTSRVLFLHAHPDDETLATGALILDLIARGVEVAVVTATRGEQGELTDPALAGDLVALRERELAAALAVLGVGEHAFLGTPPARATGLPPRRYTDSGMAWVTPELAGPGPAAGPDSLTAASVEQAAADLAGYARWFGADVLVSYDEFGGYGHPDHVACHHIARAAARLAGIGFAEVVSGAEQPSLDQYRPRVAEALRCYRSQLRIEADEVVHVGGQRHPIPTVAAIAGAWSERSTSPAPPTPTAEVRRRDSDEVSSPRANREERHE